MRSRVAMTVWPAMAEQASIWSRLRATFARKPAVVRRGTYVAPEKQTSRS